MDDCYDWMITKMDPYLDYGLCKFLEVTSIDAEWAERIRTLNPNLVYENALTSHILFSGDQPSLMKYADLLVFKINLVELTVTRNLSDAVVCLILEFLKEMIRGYGRPREVNHHNFILCFYAPPGVIIAPALSKLFFHIKENRNTTLIGNKVDGYTEYKVLLQYDEHFNLKTHCHTDKPKKSVSFQESPQSTDQRESVPKPSKYSFSSSSTSSSTSSTPSPSSTTPKPVSSTTSKYSFGNGSFSGTSLSPSSGTGEKKESVFGKPSFGAFGSNEKKFSFGSFGGNPKS